jgi:hypothetical protein
MPFTPAAPPLFRCSLLANALVQLLAHYHHCGDPASEKRLSAETFVRQSGQMLGTSGNSSILAHHGGSESRWPWLWRALGFVLLLGPELERLTEGSRHRDE